MVLARRDLLGAAQTGTGKTAGFTLPLLQLLAEKSPPAASARRPVRALILTPTRELAAQVCESVRGYGKHLRLRSAAIFGGVSFGPQLTELRRGVDILVATPGRLLDHVQQRTLDLSRVEILILDEADRMLDMGFIPAIRRIITLLPKQRQNLLFSATFPEEIRTLARSFMRDPVTVEVARRNTPTELVAQVAHPVDQGRKRELLAHLVTSNNWQQVLVFTRTKHGADRLATQLWQSGIEADAIHGNKSQQARTRTLKRFKDFELRVLVATDIAARGLDIESLPQVVNFDLPHVAEDYVHRIGRTGRAGTPGEAISLVSAEERRLLSAIERLINRQVESRVVPGFEPSHAAHARESRPRTNRPNHAAGRTPGAGTTWKKPASRGAPRRDDSSNRTARRPVRRDDAGNRSAVRRPARRGPSGMTGRGSEHRPVPTSF